MTVQFNLSMLHDQICSGIRSVHGPVRIAKVRKILAKIIAAHPQNPKGYAFIAGRNWAIDQLKRKDAAKRKAALEQAKRREQQRLAKAKTRAELEFLSIVAELSPTLRDSQQHHLEIVWMQCFGGQTDANVADIWPDSNPNLRYQWKRRGVKLLLPHASQNLVNHLHLRRSSR